MSEAVAKSSLGEGEAVMANQALFTFIWRSAKESRWHVKRLHAVGTQDAFTRMQSHLLKLRSSIDQVVLDHVFHRQAAGESKVALSLTTMENPFTIEYSNATWAPNNRPEPSPWFS